jgi:hypothetical protein
MDDAYSANPARSVRTLLGHPKLETFAQDLRISIEALRKAEDRQSLSPEHRNRLEMHLLGLHAQRHNDPRLSVKIDEARERLRAPLAFGDAAGDANLTSVGKNAWHSEFEPVEREALAWALQFRNYPLLQELAGHARRSGLKCELVRDGLVIKGRGARSSSEWESAFAEPGDCQLEPGDVVLLGASERHPHGKLLFSRFSELLVMAYGIREYPDRPAYLGYPTCLKTLYRGTHEWHSGRYMKGGCLYYEDVAVILHAPMDRLFWRHPYGTQAKRLVWIASVNRLANGLAVRLIATPAFRERQNIQYDFQSNQPGAFVFKAIAKNDGHGTEIRLEQL